MGRWWGEGEGGGWEREKWVVGRNGRRGREVVGDLAMVAIKTSLASSNTLYLQKSLRKPAE